MFCFVQLPQPALDRFATHHIHLLVRPPPGAAQTVSKSCMRGAAISSMKRLCDKVQDAGTPFLSRYQLLQPVTQMVFAAAATRSASKRSIASCVALPSRYSPSISPSLHCVT